MVRTTTSLSHLKFTRTKCTLHTLPPTITELQVKIARLAKTCSFRVSPVIDADVGTSCDRSTM